MNITTEIIDKVTHSAFLTKDQITRLLAEAVAVHVGANLDSPHVSFKLEFPRPGVDEVTIEITVDHAKLPKAG